MQKTVHIRFGVVSFNALGIINKNENNNGWYSWHSFPPHWNNKTAEYMTLRKQRREKGKYSEHNVLQINFWITPQKMWWCMFLVLSPLCY